MSEIGDQLKIQQQINDVLIERQVLIRKQNNDLASQSRLAKQLCKAMDKCNSGAGGSAESTREMNDALEEGVENSETLSENMQQAAESSSNAGGGGFLSKLGSFASSGVLGALGGAVSFLGKIGGILSGAVGLVGSLVGGFFKLGFSILKLPFQMFGNLVEWIGGKGGGGPSPIKLAMEEIRESFGNLANREGRALNNSFRTLRKTFYSAGKSGLSLKKIYGPGRGGMAEAGKDLTKMAQSAGIAFSQLKDEFEKNGGELIRLRKGLGLSDEAFGAIAQRAAASGKSLTDELTKIGSIATVMGEKFNMSSKLIGKDMGELIADVENFGHIAPQEIGGITTYARRLGIEIKQLAGVVDKFLNFEDAAESASTLQQAFGANVDTMKLLKAQNPAEQIEHLRQAMFRAGKSIDNMDAAERKLLAQTTGLSGASLEAAFSASKQGQSYEDIQKQSKKTETSQMKQIKVLKELSKNIKRTFGSGGGTVKGFWDAFTKGIGQGIVRSEDFRKVQRNIARDLKITRRLGKNIGKDFMSEFPGIKEFMKGFADIFDPTRFQILANSIREVFKKFFKMIGTEGVSGREAVDKLMSDLWTAIEGWFTEAGPGGKKMYSAMDTFTSAIGKVFGGVFDWLIDKIMMGATKIMNALSDALDPNGSFLDTPAYKRSWSQKFMTAVGEAWDNLVAYLKSKFTSSNPIFRDMTAAWGRLAETANAPGGFIEKLKLWWKNKGLPIAEEVGGEIIKALASGMLVYIAGGYILNKVGGAILSKLMPGPGVPGQQGLFSRAAGFIADGLMKGVGKVGSSFANVGKDIFNFVLPGAGGKMSAFAGSIKSWVGGKFSPQVLGTLGKFAKGAGIAGVGFAVAKGIYDGFQKGDLKEGMEEAGSSILSSLTFGLVDKETIKKYGGMLSDGLADVIGSVMGQETVKEMIDKSNSALATWQSYLNDVSKTGQQVALEGQAAITGVTGLITAGLKSEDAAARSAAKKLQVAMGNKMTTYKEMVTDIAKTNKIFLTATKGSKEAAAAEAKLTALKGQMSSMALEIKSAYAGLEEDEKLAIQKGSDTAIAGIGADYLARGKVTAEAVAKLGRIAAGGVNAQFEDVKRLSAVNNIAMSKETQLLADQAEAGIKLIDEKRAGLLTRRNAAHMIGDRDGADLIVKQMRTLSAKKIKIQKNLSDAMAHEAKHIKSAAGEALKERLGEEKKTQAVEAKIATAAKKKAELAKGPDWSAVSRARSINSAKKELKRAKKNLPAVLKLVAHLSSKTISVMEELDSLAPRLDRIAKISTESVALQVEKVVKTVTGMNKQLGDAEDVQLDVRLSKFARAVSVGSTRVKISKGDFKINIKVNVRLGTRDVLRSLTGDSNITSKQKLDPKVIIVK